MRLPVVWPSVPIISPILLKFKSKVCMGNKLRIISDGTASGTRVYAGDVEIDEITKIEFLPIEPMGIVEVKLTFKVVELDVVAELAG